MTALAPYLAFADVVLAHEALVVRLEQGEAPRDFAGLYVDDNEVTRLLGELPGIATPDRKAVASVDKSMKPALEAARQALHDFVATGDSLFAAVAWNSELGPEETEVLALLAAVEAEPKRQRLIGYIQDNVTLNRPTLATLRRLFPEPHPGPLATSQDSALRRACLINVPDEGPWGVRMVSVAPPVMWALAGDSSLDPDLPVGSRVLLDDQASPEGAGLLLVTGGDRTSRLRLAMSAAAGVGFLVTPLPAEDTEWAAVVRESTVAGVTPIVEVGGEELPRSARGWLERSNHLAWVISSDSELTVESLPERPWQELRADNQEASVDEWMATFGSADTGGHRLNREQLRLASLAYSGVGEDVNAAVRRLASGHLDRLARKIRPRRTWDDLVLPTEQLSQLHELVDRYRHRDKVFEEWGFKAFPSAGLVALFAGQSGTGKTLTAEIIAADLGLDLYKIDLSSVVSKYIGETEKNLESIFSAASAGNLVLFFDEADSLFGKRSDVGDAHDRYANIEVSYLLQRIESYDGFVVMATNLQKNIDQAFLRRIHTSVEFPMPEEDERRAIWALSFPSTTPAGDIDLDFLARQFKIAGGSIRNAALNAGFLAAARDEPITMEIVVLGLKREFQKLGRLRTEAEFDRYFDLVKGDSHAPAAG
jgi:AAA+ superfamily predicted ATPase